MIKTGVVEDVTFEYEIYEVPRGRDYWISEKASKLYPQN